MVDRADLIAAVRRRCAGGGFDNRRVLIDCDTGLGRTGVTIPDAAVALARAIVDEEGLTYAGIQAYAGQVQHVFDYEERRVANRVANNRLRAMIDALNAAGFPPEIVSGGGTGSHALDFEDKILTKCRRAHTSSWTRLIGRSKGNGAGGQIFRFALFVAVTVTAHSANGEAITDGGTKSFAVDGPPPRAFIDGVEIGTIVWAGDEFGRLKTYEGFAPPPAGTRLECTVPHCDPTSNLHDVIHLMRGDSLEAIWRIEGRGLSD